MFGYILYGIFLMILINVYDSFHIYHTYLTSSGLSPRAATLSYPLKRNINICCHQKQTMLMDNIDFISHDKVKELVLLSLATFCVLPLIVRAELPPTSTAPVVAATHRINQLSDFIDALEHDKISKVVFNGINPQSATVYFKAGDILEESFDSDHGFPFYDDPRSPAGPIQLIAK